MHECPRVRERVEEEEVAIDVGSDGVRLDVG